MKSRCLAMLAKVLILVVLLSGCNAIGLDVENQLIPPQNDKEQQAMQTALRQALGSDNYMLSYPVEGGYQTPYILLSQAAETQEDAKLFGGWGIAFYRWNLSNAKTDILLFKKDERGIWQSIAGVEGLSAGITEVNFADVTGDGFPELLVGWNLYNTADKYLSVYRMDQALASLECEVNYTALITADMTDDNAEDILLITREKAQAALYTYRDNAMQLSGDAELDATISTILGATESRLSPTVNGVFVDCVTTVGKTITEVLYWDGSALRAPLSSNGTNTITARDVSLRCQDIDGDGTIEWPITRPFMQEENLWYADWFCFDFRSEEAATAFSTIVNMQDGYILKLGDWAEDALITYDTVGHLLEFREDEQTPCFMGIFFTGTDEKIELPEGYIYLNDTTRRFAVHVDGQRAALETVQQVFFLLETKEGDAP